jgi:hypothetical protein
MGSILEAYDDEEDDDDDDNDYYVSGNEKVYEYLW